MPYLQCFTGNPLWKIHSLRYLYTFVRAQYNYQRVHHIFINILKEELETIKLNNKSISQNNDQPQEQNWSLLSLIMRHEDKNEHKLLLTRYISLPSLLAEQLNENKINIGKTQEAIIIHVIDHLPQLEEDTVAFLINKIVMQGYGRLLLRSLHLINKHFEDIVKKNSILIEISKAICNEKKESNEK